MIDLSFSEMLLLAVVAIVVIGPKDLPRVMAKMGRWVGQGKAMVRQLRHGFDEMVRETEMQEMEKRWAEQNRRIMEEHPDATESADEERRSQHEMQPLPKATPSEGDTDHTEQSAVSDDTGSTSDHEERARVNPLPRQNPPPETPSDDKP